MLVLESLFSQKGSEWFILVCCVALASHSQFVLKKTLGITIST